MSNSPASCLRPSDEHMQAALNVSDDGGHGVGRKRAAQAAPDPPTNARIDLPLVRQIAISIGAEHFQAAIEIGSDGEVALEGIVVAEVFPAVVDVVPRDLEEVQQLVALSQGKHVWP